MRSQVSHDVEGPVVRKVSETMLKTSNTKARIQPGDVALFKGQNYLLLSRFIAVAQLLHPCSHGEQETPGVDRKSESDKSRHP